MMDFRFEIPDSAIEPRGRQDWRVTVEASKLRSGAQAWFDYHNERALYWGQQREDLEEKARESGVELREQKVTGGSQFTAQLDQALAQQLAVAVQKTDEHERRADEFSAWALFFETAGAQTFACSAGDLQYFMSVPPEIEVES